MKVQGLRSDLTKGCMDREISRANGISYAMHAHFCAENPSPWHSSVVFGTFPKVGLRAVSLTSPRSRCALEAVILVHYVSLFTSRLINHFFFQIQSTFAIQRDLTPIMSSVTTTPAFVHHGTWDDTTRKHPAMKWM